MGTQQCLDSEHAAVALFRQSIIQPLARRARNSSEEILEASHKIGVSPRQTYRLIKDYRSSPYLDTLRPLRKQVLVSSSTRLPADVEAVIEYCIEKFVLGRSETISPSKLLEKIEIRCSRKGLIPPSLSTVKRRMKQLPELALAQAGQIKGSRRSRDFHPNHHLIQHPLQQVQIDHTLVDQFLDLRRYGLGIRRPWLTLAIDVATRLVYGYYIGLKPPTARTFQFVLLQGALPKRRWFNSRGLDLDKIVRETGCHPQPLFGLCFGVHMDNGRDLKSKLVQRACQYLGISTHYRPVGKPHYGGHIERLIGTFMGHLKMLPGTSYSNVVEKAEYESAKQPLFTLEEFESWFLLDVAKYHTKKHRILDCTPLQQYEKLRHLIPRTALAQVDPEVVRYAFCERYTRKVTCNGVRIKNRDYLHPDLQGLVGSFQTIVVNPWDIRSVSLSLDGCTEHLRLNLVPDGSDIVNPDIWCLSRNRPEVIAETRRQEAIALLFAEHQEEIEQCVRRRPRGADVGPTRIGQVAKETGLLDDIDISNVLPFPRGERRYE